MKLKKRRNTDFIIFFVCAVAFLAIMYLFFFARIDTLTAPSKSSLNSNKHKENPERTITEKLDGPSPVVSNDSAITLPDRKIELAHDVKMYNRHPFEKEVYSFFPSEKIYVAISFPNLTPGRTVLNANWINPTGRQVNSSQRVIELEENSPHRTYFWLEIMPNGAFTEMFSGREYKKSVYGDWKVQVFMNAQLLKTVGFTIHE